jgi:hypothetical protein
MLRHACADPDPDREAGVVIASLPGNADTVTREALLRRGLIAPHPDRDGVHVITDAGRAAILSHDGKTQ